MKSYRTVRVFGPVADAKVEKIIPNVEGLLIRTHGAFDKLGITPVLLSVSLWS